MSEETKQSGSENQEEDTSQGQQRIVDLGRR